MPTPPPIDLDALSLDDLKCLVVKLLARVAAQDEEIRALRDELAQAKKLPKRPKLAASGMDKATAPDKHGKRTAAHCRKRKGGGGKRTPPATEERTLTVAVLPGSRRKGYETYTVQDLALTPRVIRYRRERWVTPDGQEILAPLPQEVSGHFGPGVVRFVLMQHFQGQVTAERLLAQLLSLGVRISKGQIIALLNQDNEAFHAEKDALVNAGEKGSHWGGAKGSQERARRRRFGEPFSRHPMTAMDRTAYPRPGEQLTREEFDARYSLSETDHAFIRATARGRNSPPRAAPTCARTFDASENTISTG